mgnify:CR=1 FL=1
MTLFKIIIPTKPNEAMVDPWLLAKTHVWAAQEAGAELRTNCEVQILLFYLLLTLFVLGCAV